MAWQDRPYYRDPGSSPTNPLMWLLSGSIPLFTAFGIRVRMHAALLLFIIFTLVFARTHSGIGSMKDAATSMTILFISVLLHEFGHCFGARWVGGHAEEILMWPLGGLAMVHPPHRPGAAFISTAMGPAVNLFICILTGVTLFILNTNSDVSIPWQPFHSGIKSFIPHDNLTYYIWWIFLVNYALLLFNLCLVFYPFDGGRMIQEILWAIIGYYRSMRIATVVGMVGAVGVAIYGLINGTSMLVMIATFGFYACYRERMMLREMGAEEFGDGIDYSAAYEPQSPPKRRSRISQRAIKRARKKAMEDRLEQERTDQILAKVSAHGMASLTWSERRALRKATEHIRKRDLEMSK
jgi:Zn-dependent protease